MKKLNLKNTLLAPHSTIIGLLLSVIIAMLNELPAQIASGKIDWKMLAVAAIPVLVGALSDTEKKLKGEGVA